jgi:hypothetical protein
VHGSPANRDMDRASRQARGHVERDAGHGQNDRWRRLAGKGLTAGLGVRLRRCVMSSGPDVSGRYPSWLNLVCTSGGLDGFERVGEVVR